MFFNLKENDLVIVEKSFYCTPGNPSNKYCLKSMDYRKVKKGSILSDLNITIKSPNDGLAPYEWDNVVGLTLKRDLKKDENIDYADLE